MILSLKFMGSFEAAAFTSTNLFFPPSHFSLLYSGRSLCSLPHFASTASRKKRTAKKFLFALSTMRNTIFKGLIEDYACKFQFTRKWTFQAPIGLVIWEPSSLCLWAEFVCEAGKFFHCCFLETIFSPEAGETLKSYKSKGICSIALKCGQWLVLHINNKKMSANILILNTFFSRAIFVRSLHIFLILIQKCSVTFRWNWIWQIADRFF